MNIQSILAKIELFEDLVITSGFKRDLEDFIKAIEKVQNRNLIFMTSLSEQIKNKLSEFANHGLGAELEIVLRSGMPFTEAGTLTQLEYLDINAEMESSEYYNELSTILRALLTGIKNNQNDIAESKVVLQAYVQRDSAHTSDGGGAFMSLVFKDIRTIHSFKEFSKALNRWNRALLVYHTLLTSESPDEIKLEQIQNGSIDVIFNIDFEIAIDLTDLIKTGLKVYGAYLLYKSKMAREIIDSYMGNKKLLEQEKQREELMLDNVKEAVATKVLEQHETRLKRDQKIDSTSPDARVAEVTNVIVDHLIKGNEVKLLSPPKDNSEEGTPDLGAQLREETIQVRERFKELNSEDKVALLQKYSLKDE